MGTNTGTKKAAMRSEPHRIILGSLGEVNLYLHARAKELERQILDLGDFDKSGISISKSGLLTLVAKLEECNHIRSMINIS